MRFQATGRKRAVVTSIFLALRNRRPTGRGRIAPATWALLFALCTVCVLGGCVRRTLKITTEPPNALVFLNDQEVGRSAVTRDFIWYGDYNVVIRKEGYKTLKTNWDVKRPWYQIVPFDFFSEILWPGRIHDVHEKNFVLEEQQPVTSEELIERAQAAKERAGDLRS